MNPSVEPFRETSTAATSRDDEFLLEYLNDRTARCPSCGYNLHRLQRPVCPECGRPLVLRVGAIDGTVWPWMLLMLALSICVYQFVINALWVFTVTIGESVNLMDAYSPGELVAWFALLLAAPFWLIAALLGKRFRRMPPALQWAAAGVASVAATILIVFDLLMAGWAEFLLY